MYCLEKKNDFAKLKVHFIHTKQNALLHTTVTVLILCDECTGKFNPTGICDKRASLVAMIKKLLIFVPMDMKCYCVGQDKAYCSKSLHF